ncbi:MAG: GGDEF domain-containing protein, partial [Candidatus Nitrotoga sp.]
MNSITLLQQNLVVEHDLQSFVSFALESVKRLGGNVFAASIPTLNAVQELRKAGAATGYPLPTSLLLNEKSIQIAWSKKCVDIAKLEQYPAHDTILQLQLHLKNSTALADPAILLQRNKEMIRHLDEVRVRSDEELTTLKTKIESQQSELQKTILQAETDSLTGLFNRRAFERKLNTAFRHTMRQRNVPLSLVLLDVDFFKQINGTFGHQHGDTYLIKVANSLRSVI